MVEVSYLRVVVVESVESGEDEIDGMVRIDDKIGFIVELYFPGKGIAVAGTGVFAFAILAVYGAGVWKEVSPVTVIMAELGAQVRAVGSG